MFISADFIALFIEMYLLRLLVRVDRLLFWFSRSRLRLVGWLASLCPWLWFEWAPGTAVSKVEFWLCWWS